MSVETSHNARGPAGTPHVLAFYLPQFHQVPENDAWHGAGFTEWSVVARSKPLYPGHRQPDLPGELGFYDLRVPETRDNQARLAREHGVTGFLYYHYWFSGRRMLNRPFQEVLTTGQPDFPFALCWANESWYRRWQGSNDEMLLEQSFSEEDDVAHIRWLIECFKDPRYIRIEGRPLLAVYRAHHLPDAVRTVELWRTECVSAGMEPPWLVMFETDDSLSDSLRDPAELGFDASAEFVPHLLSSLLEPSIEKFASDEPLTIYEYDEVAAAYRRRPGAEWIRYPCVATGWDNSPRRQAGEAIILRNATPEGYGRWLATAAARQATSGRDGIVFLNAWNEWAEGAHLEPGEQWGRAHLEVTRDVLRELFGEVPADPPSPVPDDLEPTPIEDLYHDLYEQFTVLQRSHSGYLSYADRARARLQESYENQLQEERHAAQSIAALNQAMADQLRFQAERMKELALPDVPSTTWLADSMTDLPEPRAVLVEVDEDQENGSNGRNGGNEVSRRVAG